MEFQQTDSGLTKNSHEPSQNSRGQKTSPIYVPFTDYANKWEISATRSPQLWLPYHDPSRPTSLAVNASLLNGHGFILKQQSASGMWHVVQAGSRFLRPLETRYAMIELE
jgi:hypothetical protein